MKQILTSFFALLFIATSAMALEPVRVAITTTAGSESISVELMDYSGGTPSSLYTNSYGTLNANSSGIISFLVGYNDGTWDGLSSTVINANVVLNVKAAGTLYAQYRLDNLAFQQAQVGSGEALPDGAGAFITDNGKTTAINPTDDFIFGDDDFNHTSGTEYKMFFDNGDGSFRVGTVTGTQWDDANRGQNSVAMGRNTIALGDYSTAMGEFASAIGFYSTAMGRETEAIGDYSTAMGRNTFALGDYSTAMGFLTTASGDYSTAMGFLTTASGDYSTAMGFLTNASGGGSTAMGDNTNASGPSSTAMGIQTEASGPSSTAMGSATIAKSYGETSIGLFNTDYSPNSVNFFNANDRLFVIGNGTSTSARSDAMIVYKSGQIDITGGLNANGSDSSVAVHVSGTAPSTPLEGSLWYDTGAGEMKIYVSGAWVTI